MNIKKNYSHILFLSWSAMPRVGNSSVLLSIKTLENRYLVENVYLESYKTSITIHFSLSVGRVFGSHIYDKISSMKREVSCMKSKLDLGS